MKQSAFVGDLKSSCNAEGMFYMNIINGMQAIAYIPRHIAHNCSGCLFAFSVFRFARLKTSQRPRLNEIQHNLGIIDLQRLEIIILSKSRPGDVLIQGRGGVFG